MLERIKPIFFTALLAGLLLTGSAADSPMAQGPDRAQAPTGAKSRVFVHADDAAHKRALIAIADRGLRHQFVSPGNELTFSAELTAGQIRALERLGASIEAVPLATPMTRQRRFGALRKIVTPAAKPYCGDGICQRKENSNICSADCGESSDPPPPEEEEARVCLPQDQREYQTLLLSGASAGRSAGLGIRLLIIDTGVNKEHPDLDVNWCKNTTTSRIKNNCKDDIGHGTHTAGSATAYGGIDGLGLFGAAPGAILGVAKICGKMLCFMDDLIRAIEVGSTDFRPDVISLSFGGPDSPTLHNAVIDAVTGDASALPPYDGALFVASAGNDGPADDSISYPAAYPEVVAVGILDANRIANRMSGRGVNDDNDDTVISDREVELAGGGFVIESTSMDGCYEIMSGTSMSAPSVAGFAAANWQDSPDATRAYLDTTAEDVNNDIIEYANGTTSGYDVVTGYGLPRTGAGINGNGGAASVTVETPIGGSYLLRISGPAGANYRIGIGSPDGSWGYNEFTTDGSGDSTLKLTPWNDPGGWLVTVDFGDDGVDDGVTDFSAAFDTFLQETD